MTLITIAIFFIAIVTAFTMLAFRAWQLRTGRAEMPEYADEHMPEISFRQIEKNMLYLTKHIVQWVILTIAKYWFITTTKTKQWTEDKWPKVYNFFKRKAKLPEGSRSSFIRRAVIESKVKIRRIKERVKREHEIKEAEKQEEPVQE